MHPTLFEFNAPVIGLVTIPSYLSLLLVGFLAGVWLARREGERRGLDGTRIVDLGFIMLLLGLLGARLLSVLADGHLMDFVHLCTEPQLVPALDSRVPFCDSTRACDFHYVCDRASNRCHPPRDCLAALKFWQGGLTFYGGLLLAVPGGLYWAHRKQLGALAMADIAAPGIMLGLAIGRVGCFLNGCCYGTATDAWTGIGFFPGSDPAHPTQLYESLGCLLIVAILALLLQPRLRPPPPSSPTHTDSAPASGSGITGDPRSNALDVSSTRDISGAQFGAMLVLYGLLRITVEVYRADPRGTIGFLSTSQFISLPLIGLGIVFIARAWRGQHTP